jgi:ribonuclease D
MHYQVITHSEALAAFCDTLGPVPLAIDTEFVRTRTYYPQLGLVQLFDGQQLALIDPVAIQDLSPLWHVLQQPERITVLHAGSEDLELINHESGAMPAHMHDTQLAAAFTGSGLSIGFNAMTQELLQVTLDKDQARTNWLARPLTDKQLHYAAADVFYLLPIYEKLMARVQQLGRMAWFEEECAALVARKRPQDMSEQAYKDIGNAWQLGRKELAVLQRLAMWREGEAKRRDLALNFVVKELHLFKCAERMPKTLSDLEQLGLLQPEIRNHGKTLLRLIEESLNSDPQSWPQRVQRLVDFPHYKSELKRLRAKVEAVANAHGVPVELLASKKTIHQYLSWLWKCADEQKQDGKLPRLLSGWRKELLGDLSQ